MDVSKYNFVFKENGTQYVYNSFTNALIHADPIIVDLLEKRETSLSDAEQLSEKALAPLIRGGFLVHESCDQLAQLKVRNRLGRFRNTSLGLTIAPTLACNFACNYCFQDVPQSTMTPETAMAVYDYIVRAMRDKRGLGICWYGGEPLLALDTIRSLSRRCIALCRTLGVPYSADIISNGYLMTPETARLLTLELGVTFWQVTIDGPPEIHDARRCLHGGHGTFETILNNVAATCGMFERVAMRVNVDKDNHEAVLPLLDILEKRDLRTRVDVYFGHVQPLGSACPAFAAQCLETREFADIEMALTSVLVDRGYETQLRPVLRGGVCMADRAGCFLIDPKGNLAKCWNSVGLEEEKVGNIFDEELNDNYIRWMSYDPFDDEECRACRHLPVCMGSCPHATVIAHQRDCLPIRFNLEKSMRLRIEAKAGQQKRQEKKP